jgi:hypothetical protein
VFESSSRLFGAQASFGAEANREYNIGSYCISYRTYASTRTSLQTPADIGNGDEDQPKSDHVSSGRAESSVVMYLTRLRRAQAKREWFFTIVESLSPGDSNITHMAALIVV